MQLLRKFKAEFNISLGQLFPRNELLHTNLGVKDTRFSGSPEAFFYSKGLSKSSGGGSRG